MGQDLNKANIYQAARKANLNDSQMQKIRSFTDMYSEHTRLSNLPVNIAQAQFNQLDPDKQKSIAAYAGNIDDKDPSRGFLGQAAYIISRPVVEPIKAVFKAAGWLSDQTTRAYRAGALAVDEGVNLAEAWQKSGANGEQVFNSSRIQKIVSTYGRDRAWVAQQISAGLPQDKIIAMAQNEEQKRLAFEVGKEGGDPLLMEAIAKVNAAKYSPGRQLANLFLPEDLEGKSGVYSWISGFGDASYRLFLDPALLIGKARKMYLATSLALTKTVGSAENVASAMQKPGVARFWNEFIDATNDLKVAREARSAEGVGLARTRIRGLNKNFADLGVDDALIKFSNEDFGGRLDMTTVTQFLQNWDNVKPLFYGQPGYKVKIMPTLSPVRKKILDSMTGANKALNLNTDSARYLQTIAFDMSEEGITSLEAARRSIMGKAGGEATAARVARGLEEFKTNKFSLYSINKKLDNFTRKFSILPNVARLQDVTTNASVIEFGRYSRLIYGRFQGRILEDIYRAGNVGQRQDMLIGLQTTVGTLRGLGAVPGGRKLLETIGNLGRTSQYSNRTFTPENPDGIIPTKIDGIDYAVYPFQATDSINILTPDDLDKFAAREGRIKQAWGLQFSKAADDATSVFVTGTLAGPRFPVRNAIEDYIFYLSNGEGVFGGIFKTVRNRRLATKIRTGVKDLDLGMVNRVAKKSDKAYFTRLFDDIDNGIKREIGKDGKEVIFANFYETPLDKEIAKRQALAQMLLRRKFNNETIEKMGARYNQYVEEFALYGNYENLLREASESAYNLNTGSDYFAKANKLNRKHGRVVDFSINGDDYVRQYGSFGSISPIDTEGQLSWAFQIAGKANDDLGRKGMELLAKYGDDQRAFVDEMAKFIDSPEMAYLKPRLRVYAERPDFTSNQHAGIIFNDLKALFSKSDGSFNEEFFGRFVQLDDAGKPFISLENFDLDWLPTNVNDLPKGLVGPRLIPAQQSGNIISDLNTRLWDWLGDANARLSRDQIVLNAAFDIRESLQPMLDDLTAKMGRDAALKQVIELSQDLAVERVLAFVDNPAVRSQMAWSMRNFARFYRATEDAYRRLYRTVRYNPEALQKIALTYEGVSHSGFIQRDDQGEPYFIYPGLAPVYAAVNKALSLFGLGDKFVAPMPLQFGSNIRMLTPSANPESWLPTFSGPLSGLSMKTVYWLSGLAEDSSIPFISQVGKEVSATERIALGEISENIPFWQAVLPGHVNRLLAMVQRDERDSQYASAFRKAVTYLEAGGHTPSATATPGELAEYQKKLRSTISGILTTRFLLGFASPASPTTTLKSDMAEWVRENGRVNFKQVYSKLIEEYAAKGNPDPVGAAMADWVKYYPEQVPYVINESDPVFQAQFKTSNAAANWVDDNRSLVSKYPEGAAFLIPQSGTFSWDAYQFLKDNGYRENKLVGDFLKESFVAKAKYFYYEQRDKYEKALQNSPSDAQRRRINAAWTEWSKEYKATRPLLQQEFAESAANNIKRTAAYSDLKNMLNETNISTPGAQKLRQMVNIYEEYLSLVNNVYITRSDRDVKARDILKESTLSQLKDIAETDPNARSAFNVLFSNFLRED
jgi:hypothetical protein